MSPTAKARLQIHFCVLLWGFTAILGKLITLAAMTARLRLAYAGIGVLVALHWLTFYGAIKLANASRGDYPSGCALSNCLDQALE